MSTREGNGPRVSTGPDSKQDYATPLEFIAAVERRFRPITLDLAAHADNTKSKRWYGPGGEAPDSFEANWQIPGLLWLNPPFNAIPRWSARCAAESAKGAEILMIVPASVGANWFRDSVAPSADVYLLNGRMSFDGKDQFPKDCLLAHYYGVEGRIRIWDWRKDIIHEQWTRGRRAA